MMTDALLEHEQGHFNIGIMCVREFLSIIKSTKFIKSQYSARLKQIFQVVSDKYQQMHTQYDAETNHSINRTAQEKWNTFFKENIPEGLGE
jgi:predicted secreted Zn-dependent protease